MRMNRSTAHLRAALNSSMRQFFEQREYLEVEVPVASRFVIPEANIPVMTTSYRNPWKAPVTLTLLPSPEYFIKQLLADGLGNMYSLGKAFRDAENLGSIHNPEFTMLEYYSVGKNYMDTLSLTDELLSALRATLESRNQQIPRYAQGTILQMTMAEAFWESSKSDLSSWAHIALSEEDALFAAQTEARRLSVNFDPKDSWDTIFNRIFLNKVENNLPQDRPLALCDYPARIACLGRHTPGSNWIERWELYIRGIEIANTFTEERDPGRIRAFFSQEKEAIEKSGRQVDGDPNFAEVCARMPEVSGAAIGWDRLIMVLLGLGHIKEAMLFSLHDILA